MLSLLLSILAAASPPGTGGPAPAHLPTKSTACPSLPGIDAVLERPGVTFILFGEYHGTVQMPQVAGAAACHAAATGRPLVIGVELIPADQPAIDKFMKSDGGPAARAALTSSPGWAEEGGRTTVAIADFIDTARRLGRARPVRVIAFDLAREPSWTSSRREQAMADALQAGVAAAPGSLAVALTGLGHADKQGFTTGTPPFESAAGRLPSDRTVTLAFARPGGRTWGCPRSAAGTAPACSVQDMPAREPVSPLGIVLDPELRPGFDGVFSPGGPYTASSPAIAERNMRTAP